MPAHIYTRPGMKTATRMAHIACAIAIVFAAGALLPSWSAHAASMVDAIARVKPSVVAIGTLMKTRSPSIVFIATGFVVGAGRHVVTNAHAVDRALDTEHMERRVVLVARGDDTQARSAEILAIDKEHDLAVLGIAGDPLPALKLGDSDGVREGEMMAFTGFPIGMVLGFHPSTHRGMVAAITPVALPGITAQQLNARMIARIRTSAYKVFQLDGTAYPGNSGSPLYDPETGAVLGIVNSVFVQGTRESAIGHPSGITYAIPSRYIRDLLQSANVPGF